MCSNVVTDILSSAIGHTLHPWCGIPHFAGKVHTSSLQRQHFPSLIVTHTRSRPTSSPQHPSFLAALQIREAKKLCPELVLVHVETLGDSSLQGTAANQQQHGGGAAAEDEGGAEGGEQEERHDRLTQKACLERYRCGTGTAVKLAVQIWHCPTQRAELIPPSTRRAVCARLPLCR